MKRIALLLPAFLLALLLIGCERAVSETPDSYLPSIMIDGVRYHLSDKGAMPGEVDPAAIQGEITSTVPLNQLPEEHGQANFGSAGDQYAFTSDGLAVMFNNEWTLFVADDLTLDDVVRLSKKGDKLGWEDFAQYKSKDVGSGLHILLYDIDDGYSLAIGCVPDEKPMYMRLSYGTAFSDDCIDIRTGDVEAFIKTRK